MVDSRVPVSVLILACACFRVRCRLCSQVPYRRVSPVVFIKGRGLTFTSARALLRAQIDEPDLLPTDTWDHTTP